MVKIVAHLPSEVPCLLRRSACLACCLLLWTSLLLATDPGWYSQPQFFAFFTGYTWGYDPGIMQVPFTGQAWGIGLNFFSCDSYIDSFRREVAAWKAKNGTYFFTISLGTMYGNASPDC
jgi:hypothetical protein